MNKKFIIFFAILVALAGTFGVRGYLNAHPEGYFIPIGDDGRAFVKFDMASSFRSIPLEKRIYGAPSDLINYLAIAGSTSNRGGNPLALTVSEPPVQLQQLLKSLPPNIAARLDRNLLGIFIVSGIGADGLSNYCFSSLQDETPQAGFIVLNIDSFRQGDKPVSANSWLSRRESAAFDSDSKVSLEAKLAGPGENIAEVALGFTLLHELGHILAIGSKVYPIPEVWRWTPENTAGFDFFGLSWKTHGKSFESLWEKQFPDRAKLDAPAGARLKSSQMVEVYNELEQTDYPTLDAARNPFEDFADSFATFAHTMVYRRPYEIRLLSNGKVLKKIDNCWLEKRCLNKRKILERLLRNL